MGISSRADAGGGKTDRRAQQAALRVRMRNGTQTREDRLRRGRVAWLFEALVCAFMSGLLLWGGAEAWAVWLFAGIALFFLWGGIRLSLLLWRVQARPAPGALPVTETNPSETEPAETSRDGAPEVEAHGAEAPGVGAPDGLPSLEAMVPGEMGRFQRQCRRHRFALLRAEFRDGFREGQGGWVGERRYVIREALSCEKCRALNPGLPANDTAQHSPLSGSVVWNPTTATWAPAAQPGPRRQGKRRKG